jgi:NAD+--asparagine ADP-ribosyltransferase
MLGEMEKIVANNLRLKTEMGVQSNHFWKATGKRFSKINERMIRIANRLKELSQ